MEISWPMISAAALIAGTLVGWFFKSPKESGAELAAVVAALKIDHDRRITDADTRITNLSLRFEGSHGKHDQALATLTTSLDKLTSRIDTLVQMSAGNGNRRGG